MYNESCIRHSQLYERIEDSNAVTKARGSVPEKLALKLMHGTDSPDFIGKTFLNEI